MNPKDKIHYTRLLLSIIGGLISGIFKFALETAGEAIMLMVLFYIFSLYIIVYLYKIRPNVVPEVSLKNIFIDGVGTFVITWLFLWVLIYNILLII
jgi:hypothetical protein